MTAPDAVNFTALPSKFSRIWRSLVGSTKAVAGRAWSSFDRQSQVLFAGGWSNDVNAICGKLTEINHNRLQLDTMLLNLRKAEYAADQFEKMLAGVEHGLQPACLHRVQLAFGANEVGIA